MLVNPPKRALLEACECDPPDFWAQGWPNAPIMPTFTPATPDAARDMGADHD